MSAKKLSTLTHNVITSYGLTAHNVVNAYRQGNARAVGFIDQTWASAVQKAAPRLNAQALQKAVSAQQTLSAYYVRGVTMGTQSADSVVDRMVDLASRGVDQVAANANRFEQSTGTTSLSSLAQAAVPAAATVYQLAQRVQARSQELVDKVAGQPAPKRSTRASAKPRAKVTAKAAAKPAANAAAGRTAKVATAKKSTPKAA